MLGNELSIIGFSSQEVSIKKTAEVESHQKLTELLELCLPIILSTLPPLTLNNCCLVSRKWEQNLKLNPILWKLFGEQLVSVAKKYTGHINHKGTNNSFNNLSFNDFRIYFSDKNTFLKHAQQKSSELLERKILTDEKFSELLFNSHQSSLNKLNMNCWEFCLVTLVDKGILTHEEITKLCNICNESSPMCLIDAFQFEKALIVTQDNIKDVKSGDIIFFTSNSCNKPWHVGISRGGLKIIENLVDWKQGMLNPESIHERDLDLKLLEESKMCVSLSMHFWLPQRISFLSIESVRKNILDFIKSNQEVKLGMNALKI